jgi:hypothetical protein
MKKYSDPYKLLYFPVLYVQFSLIKVFLGDAATFQKYLFIIFKNRAANKSLSA